MPCDQANYERLGTSQFLTGSLPGSPSEPGGPYLIVSSDPETIEDTPTGPVTLYRGFADIVGTQRTRLFFWPLNESGVTLTFGIRIKGSQVAQYAADAVKLERNLPFANNYAAAGMCLAKA